MTTAPPRSEAAPRAAAGPRAVIEVDLEAVAHNVRVLRELAGVPLMAVLKADAYGHGLVPVARAARRAGAEWIATATPEEALAVREAGDTGPLLCWLSTPGDDLGPALTHGIEVTAYSVAELDAVAATLAGLPDRGEQAEPPGVQLKVDTGLSRGGARVEDWARLWERARVGELDSTWRITGIWSHLACADEPGHPANDAQQAAFERALAGAEAAGLRPTWRHLANSAATILRPGARYDLVRCGIAVYGLDPAPGQTPDIGLVPAMTVRARLALVKPVAAGDGVSYGHTWVAPDDTVLGLVPVGYGDGLPRHAGTPGDTVEMLVGGRRRPVRGRVCMDQVVIDLGPGSEAEAGDEVVLLGRPDRGEPTAQEWAEVCDTISYEIVTRIGGRMSRTYLGEVRHRAGEA